MSLDAQARLASYLPVCMTQLVHGAPSEGAIQDALSSMQAVYEHMQGAHEHWGLE